MNRVQKIFLILISTIILALVAMPLYGQETLLQYNGSGSYIYIERTDLRRYDNGKYTGLVSREIRSFISPMGVPKGGNPRDSYYDGNFYVAEGTLRARASVGEEINNSIPSTFKITPDGQLVMIKDNGYPTFRSFPAFTRKAIKYGDRWQAKAERVVDPLNKGVKTKMPIYVEYTYLRDDSFHGEEVYVIGAQWATRYGLAATLDFGGDRDLKFAQGSHKANILVSKVTGNALVVRDTVDEEFQYTDGTKVAFKGTISMFTEYPPAYDKEKLFPALQRIASVSKEELKEIMDNPVTDSSWMDTGKVADKASGTGAGGSSGDSLEDSAISGVGMGAEKEKALAKAGDRTVDENISSKKDKPNKGTDNGRNLEKKASVSKKLDTKLVESNMGAESSTGETKVTVENTAAGIRLTMQNLKFKPDSAELLGGESQRLDDIADLLKMVPDQMILIEGHTASVGNPKGEMQLSLERADSIKKALVKRGVGADKFIVKGSGGTKPVADNSTAAGKARNRRVEITILE
ncbi:OmpA family protein [Treponema sp.]|uniref:OmpA family protein n=1 Tax=Treponema sp. TaxID=166 RepID=UPI00388D7CC1